MLNPVGITLDAANNRALVIDVGLIAVFAVDLTNGNRLVLSNAETGSGPNLTLSFGGGITLDAANKRVLVVESSQDLVLAIEGSTAERAILSK